MNKYHFILFLMAALNAEAGDFFIEVGVYMGSTDYSIYAKNDDCALKTRDGNCHLYYSSTSERVNGPLGKLEFGYTENNTTASCFHLSSMSTSKDSGINACGISYRFK